MNPNNFFSPARFSRLILADLQLNYKTYLYFFSGLSILLYVFATYNLYNAVNMPVEYYSADVNNYYEVVFMVGLAVIGIFLGSCFPELRDKIRAGNYLLLPASTFEKLLSQFFIYIVGGYAFFILIFWIDTHLARWTIMQTEAVISSQRILEAVSFSKLWNNGMIVVHFIFLGSGFFMFTARLFFKSHALIKSLIALFIFTLLCWQSLSLASHIFFPEKTNGWGDIAIPIYNTVGRPDLSNVIVLFTCIAAIICITALPLAYFKLKEKEV